MINQLHSEKISKHLYIIILFIIVSVVLISTSIIVDNYHKYQLSQKTLAEIKGLKMAAELAHLISRERGPSNRTMSSTLEELQVQKQELIKFRQMVDDHIQQTQQKLLILGFHHVVHHIDTEVKPALKNGRIQVDYYINLPLQQRNAQDMEQAIWAMYKAWEATYIALQHLVKDSQGRESNSSDYYTLMLVLADLRDQAGRVASNIMPAVTFNQPISNQNLGRTFQTQRQVHYLWQMIDVIQPENRKTAEFIKLYQCVNSQFLQQGLSIINTLIDESLTGQSYSMTATELTNSIVGYFLTVIDLQNYLLEQSVTVAEVEYHQAKEHLIFTLMFSFIGISAVFSTLIYARYRIFNPLILARESLIELVNYKKTELNHGMTNDKKSLFSAIQDLKLMLQQRDDLEFRLKNIANSDALTGVANRLALDEYIKYSHNQPNQFYDTCLVVIDIDYFKQVNDRYGHLIGDEVIKQVANILKQHVRTSDLIVRYGGDEFLILMQHLSMTRILAIAENIRSAVFRHKIKIPHNDEILSVSLSIGLATGIYQWQQLMHEADQALLQAKANGRNNVQSA